MNSVKNGLPVADVDVLRNEIKACEDLGYDYQVKSTGSELTFYMSALTKELFEERSVRCVGESVSEWNQECIADKMANVIIYLTKLTLIFQNQDDVQSRINDKMAKRGENKINSVKNELPVADADVLRNAIKFSEFIEYDFQYNLQVTSTGNHLIEYMFALTKELFEERCVSNKLLKEWKQECIADKMANVIINLTKLTLIFHNQDDVQSRINSKMAKMIKTTK